MKILLCSAAVILTATSAFAHDANHQMSAEAQQGNWNVSYNYSVMGMKGLRDGTGDVSSTTVIADGYMMAPTKMTTQTHSVAVSYAVTPTTQISVTIPYNFKDMEHTDGTDIMKMKSEGIGDVKLMGRTKLDEFSLYYGLSLPTGSVNEKDNGDKLEYMMQQGSGTYDPIIGVGYAANYNGLDYGADASAIIRFTDNNEDYRLGNEYNASVKLGGKINHAVKGQVRLDGKIWQNVHGADADFMAMHSPSMDADKQGGKRIDAVVGLGFKPAETVALSTELTMPLYQHLDGPQLEQDYMFMVGLQKDL